MTLDDDLVPSVGDLILDSTEDLLDALMPVQIGERWPVIRAGQRALISRDLRRLIWYRDGRRCLWCGEGHKPLQLDHIIPWSAGGPDISTNLRLLCGPCNEARSNFRTDRDTSATPITRACDTCIRGWVAKYGFTRFGRIVPDNPEITAFCGTCMDLSVITDPGRVM